jgi:dual specificity tyrosine-phosphorylation-regulated kinase 2/3/4
VSTPSQSRSSRRHGGKTGNGGSGTGSGSGGGGGDAAGTLPLSPHAALKMYGQNFTEYEQSEVLDFPQVYFTGHISAKTRSPSNAAYNHGFDDERGDYTLVPKDHVGYRFEVLGLLGKGSFGQVAKCYDFKKNKLIALKIIRNKKRFHHQALVEVKILETVRDRDVDDNSGAIHIGEHFYFRNHLCITFDLLSINLYEFIKNNNFHGLSLGLIRRFAVQLLTTLRYMRSHSIIHCDLKPENILLRHPNKVGIKVIDFGSSCFENERVYTYIQSRFYRSPEVILGLPYGCPIDMWSLGCILAELYTGYPLFPGESEVEQLLCIMEILDVPPRAMVSASTRKGVFFDGNGSPRIVPNSRGKKRRPGTRELGHALKCSDQAFVSFLRDCLAWDPEDRMTADQALAHEFVADAGGSRTRPSLPDPRRGRRGHGSSTGGAAGGSSGQAGGQQLPSIGAGSHQVGMGGGYASKPKY